MTVWGQNLMVVGSDPIFGSWNIKQGIWMTPHHEGDVLVWQAFVSVPEAFEFEYRYCLVDEKLNVLKWEALEKRKLAIPEGLADGAVVDILDNWQDGAAPEVLLSRAAFKKVIFQEVEENGKPEPHGARPTPSLHPDVFESPDTVVVRFKVHIARLERGQSVYVAGNRQELGGWDNTRAVPLVQTGGSTWEVDVPLSRALFPIQYKYLLKDNKGGVVPEEGADIELALDTTARKPSTMIVVNDGHFRSIPWKGAGVAVPVFSIRTEEDVGSGEFLDLKLVVDLAVKSGLHLVQLLPVNDTSVNMMWWDSYPYSSLSVFALHPLYLRVQALSDNLPEAIKSEIEAARRTLNKEAVEYEGTLKAKLGIAKKVYLLEKDRVLKSADFSTFFDENKGWLRPYAAFCFLRDLFGTANHSQWGALGEFSQKTLDRLVSPEADHYGTVAFHYYVQYHLYKQLKEAADYARANRVVFKGDLPIGVDRNSVDTWQFPTLFRMNTSTGAPPDYFDPNGQNWGFPTYNWEEMAKDNYAWWRMRLTQMSKFFSAYRIDHILGFFRIWEMPDHACTGIRGKFRPALPLTQKELEGHGLWDFNRLSQPYIRTHILQDAFGAQWKEIASKFLNEFQEMCYEFKEEYSTEKKIAAALTPRPDSPDWLKKELDETKKGLFKLMSNICLIRDPEDPAAFHPRFNLQSTSNYGDLDEHSKAVLQALYTDYYFGRQEQLWRENALKTLPVLMNASDMLACGEDLGLIPACVPPVLSELGLLGLRIQRMPSKPGQEFGLPVEYEYMTVCAPSCHDTSTMRAWWEEDKERRDRFFRNVLGFSSAAPDKCDPDVSRAIVQQHMEAPSVWAIFPLQDLMALKAEYSARPSKEETINDPTNPKHYWRFRLHVTIEKLLGDKELTGGIKELTVASHRAAEEGGAQERGPAPAKVHPYMANGTVKENGVMHQV
ncbi:4-alpha-glucanotransferase [Klebsormidium nitens]|uniref:4-alpha-glucanotransferase n=1 Tax=Klebsormidium nitens TaxID=105231 RepID=A0A1Y1HUZ9_KLENI|nr:4-alpha-glucanotransferase [Klebsormidium nitens]|eukprot:GAQ80801.1 4-alpha-glucanotransferase [Klebsormidium nitens]